MFKRDVANAQSDRLEMAAAKFLVGRQIRNKSPDAILWGSVAIPRQSEYQFGFVEILPRLTHRLDRGAATYPHPRCLSPPTTRYVLLRCEKVRADLNSLHPRVVVAMGELCSKSVLVSNGVLDRRSKGLACHKTVPIELLDSQMTEVLVPEKIFLRVRKQIIWVRVIANSKLVARIPLDTVIRVANETSWDVLNRLRTPHHVEIHQAVPSHTDSHRATLEPLLQAA